MTRQEKETIAGLLVWFIFAVMATIASKATTDIRGSLIAVCASSAAAIAFGRGYTSKAWKAIIVLLVILAALHAILYFLGKGYPHPLNLIPVAVLLLSILYAKQKERQLKQREMLLQQQQQRDLEEQRIAREVDILREINEEMRQEQARVDMEVQYELNQRIKRVNQMTGVEFEHYCAGYLLKHRSFKEARTTKVSGDYGADIIGIDAEGKKWVVQCKRYGGSVGNTAVQEVVAAKAHYGASHGMVMTNSYLTPGAKRLARENNIEVIERMM